MRKKQTMRIGTASRFITGNRKYRVNYGSTGNAYNRQFKNFKTRAEAIRFVNKLKTKFKSKYKIDYMYLSD